MKFNRIFAVSAIALGLWACSDDNKSTQAPTTSGVLTDAAISGVAYRTSSGLEGVTSSSGTYSYRVGDTVTFNVGGVTLSAPAVGRVTPAVLAAALFPNAADAAENATLNLAILFQTLDSNGNPDDGITLPNGLAITGLATNSLGNEPTEFVQALNANDSVTPGDKAAVNPSDAAEHYYANELPGTWIYEDNDSLFTLTIDDSAGDDRSLRYIVAEIGKENNFTGSGTGVEAGIVDFEDSGKVVLSDLDSNSRTRGNRACPIAYGERYSTKTQEGPDVGTGAELKLVGEDLEITTSSSGSDCAGVTVKLKRHKPVKNTMVGTWVDDAPLNKNGNAQFNGKFVGNSFVADDIFQIYFADQVIAVTLDCDNSTDPNISTNACGNEEKNGLFFAKYTFDSVKNVITLGDVIIDQVSVTNKIVNKGDKFNVGPASENDTRRISEEEGGEFSNFSDRLLSLVDLNGDFKLPSPLKKAAGSDSVESK